MIDLEQASEAQRKGKPYVCDVDKRDTVTYRIKILSCFKNRGRNEEIHIN